MEGRFAGKNDPMSDVAASVKIADSQFTLRRQDGQYKDKQLNDAGCPIAGVSEWLKIIPGMEWLNCI
jgi:hypothetical protein